MHRVLNLGPVKFWDLLQLNRQYDAGEGFLDATICLNIYGGTKIKFGTPRVKLFKDAIFVPKALDNNFSDDPEWGLYDKDGNIIDYASYTRGIERVRVGQSRTTKYRPKMVAKASKDPYFYAGPFHFHYGHFLLVTVGRLWPFLTRKFDGLRVAYHGRDDPDTMFRTPFVHDITSALGLCAADFSHIVEPTRLPEVWVPEPCFDEDQSAYRIYADLAFAIGRHIRRNKPCVLPSDDTPVYLSKSRLRQGVWRFHNEQVLEDHLRQRGVEIVYPETLTLFDQIKLFENGSVVISNGGSSLHTSIFATKPNCIIGVSRSSWIHSSQIIIDKLKKNRALYLDISKNLHDVGPSSSFGTNVEIIEPERMADALMAAASAVRAGRPVPQHYHYRQAKFG